MLIGNEWRVESDSLNVILYRRTKRVKKDTKEPCEVWRTVGYFATVAGALRELVNQGVRDSELREAQSITKKIGELYALIDSVSVPQP